ncbi:MAG: class I SAM-dependent methyltransferase [Verrucomicrobia bacterium]|nr:class I SAM-dependent methyltransferase [Verrucomicrobiota bacterium]
MKFRRQKALLARFGRFVSPRLIHYASGQLNYLNVGRWFHDRKLSVPVRCDDREPLYNHIATLVQEPVSYLEFGVFKGSTLRHWSGLLKHQGSLLHGFDSFEGLPEIWGYFVDKATLDVGGVMPKFEDPRVQLFKGWFNETLPPYLREFKPNPVLILHLDADVYSSTIFVLRELKPFLRPGTVLIFDEFFDREHELKAFSEFLQEFPMTIECVGATKALTQAAFRIKALPTGTPGPSKATLPS